MFYCNKKNFYWLDIKYNEKFILAEKIVWNDF